MARKKKVASKYEGLSKDEKRSMVLSEGATEVHYWACPMCGCNRPLRKYESGEVSMTNIDLNRFHVLVTRVGGGLGSGFFRIDEKSLTLPELVDGAEYQELLEQMKEQGEKILKALK